MRPLLSGIWVLAITAAASALATGVASADVIALPECPHGWTATHAGHSAYCAPHACTSDGECGGGHCVDVARCFRTQTMDTGRAVLPPGTPPATYEAPVDALCGANDSCGPGTHCAHERECTEVSRGLCSIGRGRARSPMLVLIALGLGMLIVVRRR